MSINHNNFEIIIYNAENQPFTCTDIPKFKNISLGASPIENMDAIVHSQPTDTYTKETTETEFNSTLLDDGTLLSSHTVNSSIDLEDHGQNTTRNNNTTTAKETTNNTNIYKNQRVNSTELTQNSDPLNTTLPNLPIVNTPLPRLQRQHSLHFNTEFVVLNISKQSTLTSYQIIEMNPQQLVNLVRQLNSQNTQQITNAPTPYYLQAASTQTPSTVVRRNTQTMYLYFGGSVPMQQCLRSFDSTGPIYTT